MTITWHPDTPQHLDAIEQAITEMENQVSISGQKMSSIVEVNQGQTMSAINAYYQDQLSPAVKRLLEDFRGFVKGARDRYTAAINQDTENARL